MSRRPLTRAERIGPDLVPHPHRFIVNLGLPRSGTTSFAAACQSIGLRVLHSWNDPAFHGKRASEDTRDYWWRTHYAKVLSGVPGPLAAFDALTDSPFYSRAIEMRRAYPNASFVCTTRSIESWIDSMVFGHLLAGGLYLPRLYGLETPYRNTTETRANLTAVFRSHQRHECHRVNATTLDVRMGSDEMWRRLCEAVPQGKPRDTCDAKRKARAPWPRKHTEVSAGKRQIHR
jgi:hypothetical protein